MTGSDIITPRLVLRLLSLEALQATEASRIEEASGLLKLKLPAEWADLAPLARLRLAQLDGRPQYHPWSIRAIALRGTLEAVGYVNFHDVPGRHELAQADACAEFGYTVFAAHRRRGYVEETIRALIDWARERGARYFIFSISPGNAASQAFARKLGVRRIGMQIDEEDGPEDVFLLG